LALVDVFCSLDWFLGLSITDYCGQIVLMIAVSWGGAGICWALWKHHLFAEMVFASTGFLCILAGLIQLDRVIPRLPKAIKDLLQW
jgi:hypothetical protein